MGRFRGRPFATAAKKWAQDMVEQWLTCEPGACARLFGMAPKRRAGVGSPTGPF